MMEAIYINQCESLILGHFSARELRSLRAEIEKLLVRIEG